MDRLHYEQIQNLVINFRKCILSGTVPLIINSDCVDCEDNNQPFKSNCVSVDSFGMWSLQYVPTSPYFSPEVKASTSLPAKFNVNSLLYNFGYWLMDKYSSKITDDVSWKCLINCYERCMIEDVEDRILYFM